MESVENKNYIIDIPRHVQDFAKGVSALRRDTGVEVKSFDWSDPMLEVGPCTVKMKDGRTKHVDGLLFFLVWDSEAHEYTVHPEARQNYETIPGVIV